MATSEEIALLRAYVGAASTVADAALAEAWDRASARISKFCGVYVADVPAMELQGSTKEVAAELFHRKNAPNGISQFADGQGNPVRVARDPMVAAYASLAPFLPGGFA